MNAMRVFIAAWFLFVIVGVSLAQPTPTMLTRPGCHGAPQFAAPVQSQAWFFRRGLVPWRVDFSASYQDGSRYQFHRGFAPWANTRTYVGPQRPLLTR